MLVLAVVALAVGIWLSRNTTRAAAERAELPARADCRRFPGACTEGLNTTPPPSVLSLHEQVASAELVWRDVLERNRRTGVFPDKGVTAMRESLAATQSAILDAYALLAESRAAGSESAAVATVATPAADAQPAESGEALALDVLREAYEQKLALLTRAIRLFEGAV